MKYDKEQIYNEKINPLMSQIFDICKENNVHMISSFYIKEKDEINDDIYCSIYVSSKEKMSQQLFYIHDVLFKQQHKVIKDWKES
jgi:hypothetical protein